MRALCRPAAGLLLAAGIIGAGIAIDAPSGHSADNTSLSVSPGEGSPDAQFTAVYRWPSIKARKHSNACVPDQVTFEWDGAPLGRAASTRAGSACVAVLRAAPPPGAYHGTSGHTISVTGDASARASYTVTERPTSSPSAGTSSATPDSATESAVDPQPTGLAGVPAPPSDTDSPTTLGQQDANSGVTGWLIAFGALLFLAGAGTFGIIAWRTRHPKSAAAAPWTPADADTQTLPLPDQATHRGAHRARRRLD
jgi:hypothetical protein